MVLEDTTPSASPQVAIGRRLKHLRKQRELSQLELESATSSSPGSISRIENGKVNPTRETLESISNALQLNEREKKYVFGVSNLLPSKDEVEAAIGAVRKYFDQRTTFAYLLDDRYRLLHVSQGFKELFKVTPAIEEKARGRHILDVALDQDLPVYSRLDPDRFDDFLKVQFSRQMADFQLHQNEQWFKELMARLNQYPEFRKIYHDLKPGSLEYLSPHSRTVKFNFGGIKVRTLYTREPLNEHPRFEVIEYMIANPLVNKLVKFLKS